MQEIGPKEEQDRAWHQAARLKYCKIYVKARFYPWKDALLRPTRDLDLPGQGGRIH